MAIGLDFARLGVARNAAQLYVDDPACAQLQRLSRVVHAQNGFVQTYRGLQSWLQLGVVDDVVVGQGLFDHQQVELVQPAEQIGVGERVGGVGVHRHQLLGKL